MENNTYLSVRKLANFCDEIVSNGSGNLEDAFSISTTPRLGKDHTNSMFHTVYARESLDDEFTKFAVKVVDKHIGAIAPVHSDTHMRWAKKPRKNMNAMLAVRKYNTNVTSNTIESYKDEKKSDYFRVMAHFEQFFIQKMKLMYPDANDITSLIQWEAKSNGDFAQKVKLVNPIRRDAFRFGDFRNPQFFEEDEKSDITQIDVTNDNIHTVLKSKTMFKAIIDLSTICISKMGISLPTYVKAIVISKKLKQVGNKEEMLDTLKNIKFD